MGLLGAFICTAVMKPFVRVKSKNVKILVQNDLVLTYRHSEN